MSRKIYCEVSIWVVLSALLGVKAIQLDLGTPSAPGPGFMLLVLAVLLFSLSVILLLQRRHPTEEKVVQQSNFKMSAFYIACSIVLYIFFFKKIGFLFSTLLLLIFLFRSMGTRKWRWVFAEAIIVTFLSYLLFGVILKLNLPTGIF